VEGLNGGIGAVEEPVDEGAADVAGRVGDEDVVGSHAAGKVGFGLEYGVEI